MTAKARPKRQYTQAERLGAIVIAVRESVPAACRTLNIAERTLYQWLEEAGGIAEVRSLANMRAEEAVSGAIAAVCNEIQRRQSSLDQEQLMMTLRKVIEAGAEGGPGVKAGASAGAAANAQVAVHNWNINANE